jgi:hypothetical protein
VRGRVVYLALFLVHASLVVGGATREIAWLVARGYTALPPAVTNFSAATESLLNHVLGAKLTSDNPGAHLLRGYLHGAGIEAGYSYFAPNLSGGYKLVFEIELPDGRIEHDSFDAESREGKMRLASFLDQLAKSPSPAMRDAMMKLLVRGVWRHYPDAVRVKAFLAGANLPTPGEYKAGKRTSYDLEYTAQFDASLSEQ